MRLLRSLDDSLYELVGWLVFYPKTLWRIMWHPGRMARYVQSELQGADEARFRDGIRPVLMLILSVLVAHALELALDAPLSHLSSDIGRILLGSDHRLLLSRSVFFSIYALGAAVGMLLHEGKKLTRESVRIPFSIQAFLVSPLVLFFSVGEQLYRLPGAEPVAVVLLCGGFGWYMAARTIAYRSLYGTAWSHAASSVVVSFTLTTSCIALGIALLLTILR